jgi:hypothetical protein
MLPNASLKRALLVAWLAACAAVFCGCTHVAPYQRENLARHGMDVKEREALRSQFYAHVFESREGAMPTSEHAGGGCGCN